MPTDTPIVTNRRSKLAKWIHDVFDDSQARFIDETGINQGELSGLLKSKSFGEKKARNLEKQAGMPGMYLDLPDGEDSETTSLVISSIEKKKKGLLTITQYDDVGGSMGVGVVLQDQPGQITSWEVTAEWIDKNIPANTGSKNLKIVTGFGDSMKGVFNPGDPVLIDVGIRVCDHDGLYFFRVGNEGFIKRLQRIPGQGILVISTNTDYVPWTITPDMDFEVLAKVLVGWERRIF